MCGIIGYVGNRKVKDVLIEGLKKLEYRGYDSAGIAIKENDELKFYKENGKLINLETKIKDLQSNSNIGIGHTRWATHGAPSQINAHPHFNKNKTIAVIHNGIIENYSEIREDLKVKGYEFITETDSEVVAHLLDMYYDGNPEEAIINVTKELKGSYALAIIFNDIDDTMYCVKKDSPLIIGIGENENFIASDVPAILEYTNKIYTLEDNEFAAISKNQIRIFNADNKTIEKKETTITWTLESAEKAGYDHYMLKEIFEQQKVAKDVLYERLNEESEKVNYDYLNIETDKFDKIYIVACGTAFYAGLIGKYTIEKLVRIPIYAEVSSEFRYGNPIIDDKTLVIAISQSGETADTLAAVRLANAKGATTLGLINVIGSSIERECSATIHTSAGPEIAVASTKAYTAQVICLYMFALYLAQMKNKITKDEFEIYKKEIINLPNYIEKVLKTKDQIKKIVEKYKDSKNIFYIGRGADYYTAKEGSLKLKEIAYVHSEAYEAGELKHGPIALIENTSLVVGIATNDELFDKTKSNLKEVKARGARVIIITKEGNNAIDTCDDTIYIPRTNWIVSSVLANIPQQIIAYYMAVMLGNDVDKPRNLAKSVTVE